MPLVKINCRKIWSKEQKLLINKGIHTALVSALTIETWDYFHRFYEFDEEDYIYPEFKTIKFMIIEIHLFTGRSVEMKKKLYEEICLELRKLEITADDIFIQLIEQPNENWGIAGKMRGLTS